MCLAPLQRTPPAESLGIALHLLIQPLGRRTIQGSQLRIEDHFAPAQNEDRSPHTLQRDEALCRNEAGWTSHARLSATTGNSCEPSSIRPRPLGPNKRPAPLDACIRRFTGPICRVSEYVSGTPPAQRDPGSWGRPHFTGAQPTGHATLNLHIRWLLHSTASVPTWDGTGRWRSGRRRAGVRDNERVGAGGDTPPKQWSIVSNGRLKAAVCVRTRRLATGVPDSHVVVVRSVELTYDGGLASRRSRCLCGAVKNDGLVDASTKTRGSCTLTFRRNTATAAARPRGLEETWV